MPEHLSLFRENAVISAGNRLGAPCGQPGVSSWLLSAFLTALLAAVIVFLANANYAKKETVSGLIVPSTGVARMASLRPALVKRILIKDGDQVSENQPLFSLAYDTVLDSGALLADQVDSLTLRQEASAERQLEIKARQIVQTKKELQERIAGYTANEQQILAQEAYQAARVELLRQTLASTRSLHTQSFISATQLRQREDELLQAQLSLVQMAQGLTRLRSQIAETAGQLHGLDFGLEEAKAQLDLSKAQLAEKRLNAMSTKSTRIVAAKAGLVTSVQVREGDLIASGQTLGFIVPDNTHMLQEVHLWVPSRAIGFVEKGTAVRLMFDAFPYQTFGMARGRVVEVAGAPVLPNEIPMPVKDGEQMFRIVVALDKKTLDAYGRTWPLSPGMRLTADLVLMERTLLDWLLEPLQAARSKLSA